MKNLKGVTILTVIVSMGTTISCQKAGIADPVNSLPAPSAAPLVPSQGALLGHFYGNGTLAATDAIIGSRPQIHLTYFDWFDHWAQDETVKQDLKEGRIPLVNWEPNGIEFMDIVNGEYDDQLGQQADEAKSLNTRFFLDFAAEMNEEEGWGGHNPSLYINAFRHIHDLFVQRGAINAVWVWCPNNVDAPGQPAAMRYYPGDKYVDWVGADGYNWGTSAPDHQWESFYAVFKDIYTKIAVTGKPVIIGETGADEIGGNKADWITQIVPTLKAQFPAIKAVVWFDVNKERQWQISSSAKSSAAYRNMATGPYFNIK